MLNGLKIIDASSVLAGPSVGSYFAELGADVIKVEHPIHGDVTRTWKLPTEDKNSSAPAYFSSVNYKKSYIRLDLKDIEGHSQFLNLVKEADILISNFKPGDDVKLGITDEQLRQVNSDLIIGKINGYGVKSDRPAYDLILQAESGIMSINGTLESGPVKMPVAFIDVFASHHLKEGILLALYQREKGIKPKTINVSLYDVAVSSLTNQASNYLMTGKVPQRMGSLHPNIAPYGEIFSTKDNVLITLAIGSDAHFSKLCQELGLVELPGDVRYNSNQNRVVNRSTLEVLLNEKIRDRNSDELLTALRSLSVPAGRINSIKEVFENERAQGLVREEEIDGEKTRRVTSVIFE